MVVVVMMMMLVDVVVVVPLHYDAASVAATSLPVQVPGVLALDPRRHLLHGQVVVFLPVSVPPVVVRRHGGRHVTR